MRVSVTQILPRCRDRSLLLLLARTRHPSLGKTQLCRKAESNADASVNSIIVWRRSTLTFITLKWKAAGKDDIPGDYNVTEMLQCNKLQRRRTSTRKSGSFFISVLVNLKIHECGFVEWLNINWNEIENPGNVQTSMAPSEPNFVLSGNWEINWTLLFPTLLRQETANSFKVATKSLCYLLHHGK